MRPVAGFGWDMQQNSESPFDYKEDARLSPFNESSATTFCLVPVVQTTSLRVVERQALAGKRPISSGRPQPGVIDTSVF